MTDRLTKIFNELCPCEVFADVGCDHGYIAKAMLDSGKAKKVVISDISKNCLIKAEELLSNDIACGRAESVVSDGFEKVSSCDLALIAGMGGEEIVGILQACKNLPEKLVLQPMKNADKVRLCAVKLGYRIDKDFVFLSAGKFYELIVLSKGDDFLTEEEVEFGRTNLQIKPLAFKKMLENKIEKLNK